MSDQDQGAREARYAEAIYSQAQFHTNWRDMTQGARNFWIDVAARGVLILVDAEVAAAVSEAQAETTEVRYTLSLAEQIIRDAVAEVERLREGVRALADEWEAEHQFAAANDVMHPAAEALGLAARDLRALLAPSPAATTGEAVQS